MATKLPDEGTKSQLKTTIRYALKQGFSESEIRKIVEQTLNEGRA